MNRLTFAFLLVCLVVPGSGLAGMGAPFEVYVPISRTDRAVIIGLEVQSGTFDRLADDYLRGYP